MSYPILYSANETNFDNNGLGVLSDCISCEVVEERNGSFEITIQYPITGIHYQDIVDRCLIKAKPNQIDEPQLFRVYGKSKPMSGVVTISASHITYDLSGIPCSPFSAGSVAEALIKLSGNSAIENPFEFWTDKTSSKTVNIMTPKSVRACLGGGEGSILDVFGGEFQFDNYTVKLYNQRGLDRGVTIKYGKNLTDIKQEENCANVYTGVYPYYVNPETEEVVEMLWTNEDGSETKILEYSDLGEDEPNYRTFSFQRIKTLDLSEEFENQPSNSSLRLTALQYLQSNNLAIPDVSLDVSFVQLEQSEEYKGLKLLESVYLCDTVTVEFPALGVNTTAKATKIVYDVLLDRVKKVHLGSVQTTLIDSVVEQKQEIEKIQEPTFLQKAVNKATKWITSGGGYMVAIKDELGNWKEIVSLNENDINTATKVWRWNNGGFGYSSTGYSGPYTTAITQDGEIVADFITTGTLNANLIKAGVLTSIDNATTVFDLTSGELKTSFATLNGGTIAGWNIDTEAFYKDAIEETDEGTYIYRSYIQSPFTAGEDTWVFSTQLKKPEDTYFYPTFYVTVRGVLYSKFANFDYASVTNKFYATSIETSTFKSDSVETSSLTIPVVGTNQDVGEYLYNLDFRIRMIEGILSQ